MKLHIVMWDGLISSDKYINLISFLQSDSIFLVDLTLIMNANNTIFNKTSGSYPSLPPDKPPGRSSAGWAAAYVGFWGAYFRDFDWASWGFWRLAVVTLQDFSVPPWEILSEPRARCDENVGHWNGIARFEDGVFTYWEATPTPYI